MSKMLLLVLFVFFLAVALLGVAALMHGGPMVESMAHQVNQPDAYDRLMQLRAQRMEAERNGRLWMWLALILAAVLGVVGWSRLTSDTAGLLRSWKRARRPHTRPQPRGGIAPPAEVRVISDQRVGEAPGAGRVPYAGHVREMDPARQLGDGR